MSQCPERTHLTDLLQVVIDLWLNGEMTSGVVNWRFAYLIEYNYKYLVLGTEYFQRQHAAGHA